MAAGRGRQIVVTMKASHVPATAAMPRNVSRLLRALLTVAFLWAGLAKVREPHLFATDITGFQIIPLPGLALGLAYYVPWVEMACAVGLWTRRWELGALAVGAGLLTVFTLALASAWARGLRLDCGCFGPGGGGTGGTNLPLAIGRNLLLLGVCAALGKWLPEGRLVLEPAPGVRPSNSLN